MKNLRRFAGVFALSLALALVGCGQAQDSATLTITSVPQAEVFVDGESLGTSGAPLTLSAGSHKIELKAEGFKTFATDVTLAASGTEQLEASLAPQDPSSPIVVARLMEAEGLEIAPWVAPETTRGHSRKSAVAVLLWPSRDVRHDGLVNFAIEADESYAGDATLEFRSGRTVLYRQPFNPEEITTVRAIPAEVLENVKVNSTIKWGLYFEDNRPPITTSFKIVRRPGAERQLERIRNSRHMARQPEITRAIAEAVVLENNRLYTEALVANLKVAADHPSSTQPFRGIVTTLRRLDAEHSELFATVAPHVSGKGQGGVSARDGGLGIAAWSPVQQGALPTPVAATGGAGAKPMGPGGMGLTPTGGTGEPTPEAVPAEENGPSAGQPDAEALRLRETLREFTARKDALVDEAARAAEQAASFEAAANEAEEQAHAAEQAASEARRAVEEATEPTREQQEEMVRAGVAAEEARESAAVARQQATESARRAARLQSELAKLRADIVGAQNALGGLQTPSTEGQPDAKALSVAQTRLDEATSALTAAQATLESAGSNASAAQAQAESARVAREAAEAAFEADPSDANAAAVSQAQVAEREAEAAADAAGEALTAARSAAQIAAHGLEKAQKQLAALGHSLEQAETKTRDK